MTVADLIARLEAAAEGSRELDAHIDAVINGRDVIRVEGDFSLATRHTPGRYWYDSVHFADAPNYTTSIDAALTLIPEGFAVRDFSIWPGCRPTVRILGTHRERDGLYWHNGTDGRWEAQGATPALALCIAALKARAEIAPE